MSERVSIFLQDLSAGGAERMMLNLAGGIIDHGVPVDMVLVRGEGALFSAIPKDVRLIQLNAHRTMNSIPALARYLRRERPAALLSALMHVNVAAILAGLLAGRCTRVVVSERSTISQESAEISAFSIHVAHKLVPWLYPRADGIIAVSSPAARDLANYTGLPLDRIRSINNPVVSKETLRMADEAIDHPWFCAGQPPVVLGVGRLSPEKDFATLIRAFAEVRRRREARLVILGMGKERAKLESLVESLGLREGVDLAGFVKNPYAYMKRAAVLALTSRWEGSPNVLVEAMACGTPVVSTDCVSGPRETLEGGLYGKLCPVGDSQGLAQAILQTLSDPMSPDLLRRRAEDFRVEHSAREYLEVLLGNGRGPSEQTESLKR